MRASRRVKTQGNLHRRMLLLRPLSESRGRWIGKRWSSFCLRAPSKRPDFPADGLSQVPSRCCLLPLCHSYQMLNELFAGSAL